MEILTESLLRRKNLKNLRESLKTPLSSSDYTVSPLRGKIWVIHSWGVVRTCVGILKGSIEKSFWVFLQFWFYLYNYNCELYMFDGPIDVSMWNCCEIDVFLCWVRILKLSFFSLISLNGWNLMISMMSLLVNLRYEFIFESCILR